MIQKAVPSVVLCVFFAAFLLSCAPDQPSTLEEIAARALSYSDTAEKASAVGSVGSFAVDLYKKIAAGTDGNLFFSPFSISTALAMTYAGARGNTGTQMASVLHFTLGQDVLHTAFGGLIGDMEAAGARDGYTLSIANSVWGQSDTSFETAFLAVLSDSYGAPLQEVDFISQPEPARLAVNVWVSEQTAGKIQDLLPSGSIDTTTRMVLANAIYFKGTWARTFEAGDTRDGAFLLPDGTSVTVPMMHQESQFNFAQDDLVKILELPYSTGDLSMILLLPQESDGMTELTAAITAEKLQDWLSRLSPANELPVAIPKFGFTAEFQLQTVLSDLGMTDAFTPGAADFTGISASEDLFIGDVFHKAFVEVNEEGTEAAAATAVTIGLTAMPMDDFTADHPFLFLIRHNRSGAILFFGRLSDPR